METIETSSKTKRFGQVAIDIALFAALAFIILTIIGIPLWAMWESPGNGGANEIFYLIPLEALTLISVFLSAWVVWRFRKVSLAVWGRSLALRRKDVLAGILLAVVLYAVGFGISLLVGAVEVAGVALNLSTLFISLGFCLLVAITEELALRGFVLERMLQGGVNKFWALFLSAALFSLIHIGNPNFDFLSFINLLLAGILLGSSYIYTRNLSFPIALHWFWNWIQGPVLGYEVSGNKFCDGLLTLHLPEANLINGGAFGFEGSILCTVLMIAGTGVILKVFGNH
ncbi:MULTISPECIES: type II CAAX endopeptidase family protein [Bacteroides]|uniref:CPBP family intramembrane glutamic endopeptidase n=1 Tax=Bacteroides TaxID=816 RepID=UPI000E43C16D|nr:MULTISPECIES: type II CAAX endopeptidase family protein [Bacteroides]MBS7574074.1 CPBP family intramembrane metalloprotease [Bacteroides propionicigenes]RGM26983.1 CPBP family intramembrane metalloprotease [Bacteroides sp. OM08-17BH]HBO06536.1 CPBP family intramembrane metalloprotease domain-containing protein [Bacteroides sp.]